MFKCDIILNSHIVLIRIYMHIFFLIKSKGKVILNKFDWCSSRKVKQIIDYKRIWTVEYTLTGGLFGNASVSCGSQVAAETSTMKLSTTTASSTTRYWSPSPTILSVEPTSAINRTIANITPSTTAAISSEESTYVVTKLIWNVNICSF